MRLSKKIALSLAALSVCAGVVATTEAAPQKSDILFGVAYYDEYMPYERLEKGYAND